MNFSNNSYFTLTLVLLTFCVSACQGQRSTCDISSRPHPRGICGPTLARAHSNLCFLLRQVYPEYFSSKRSAGDSFKERLLNVPLSALAELELSLETRDVLLGQTETPYNFLNTQTLFSDGGYSQYLGRYHQPLESDGTRMTKTVLQLLTGKGDDRVKRGVPQSSMVCDCCYNVCTTRHLATYC